MLCLSMPELIRWFVGLYDNTCITFYPVLVYVREHSREFRYVIDCLNMMNA